MTDPIPFYGATEPDLFAIERRAMDHDGVVLRTLDALLPEGRVLDVGAGDGFTAERLTRPGRVVVALEPEPRMVRVDRPVVWARGVAQDLPFHDGAFEGAYATWAFFLPGVGDRAAGLAELHRVVRPGGPILLVDNAGDDAFEALAPRPLSDDGAFFRARGFSREVLHTAWRFADVAEARRLLGRYFGPEVAARVDAPELEHKVALYRATSRGA